MNLSLIAEFNRQKDGDFFLHNATNNQPMNQSLPLKGRGLLGVTSLFNPNLSSDFEFTFLILELGSD